MIPDDRQGPVRRAAPLLLALLGLGCFSTVGRTRPVDPAAPAPEPAWEGPQDPDVGGAYDGASAEVVLEVTGTFQPGPMPSVPGVREECRTVGSGSLLAGEILGGFGAALGGTLGGVGLYRLAAGCADPDCQAVGLGAGVAGLVVLAGAAALFAGSLALDLTREADAPYDCVEVERVPFRLPPPPPERRAVARFGAVAPDPAGGAATLVPAIDGRVVVPVDPYLGCPERCAVRDPQRDLAARPEARPFVEDVAIEVPVVAIDEDGAPGRTLGTERFRVRTVKLRALLQALAAELAAGQPAGAFARLRVTVRDAAGRPAADAPVRVFPDPPAPGADPVRSAEPPLLALHATAPELYRAALRRALADRWRAQADAPSAVAVPEGEGEARTSADGTALFLLPPGASVRVSAEIPGQGPPVERPVDLPSGGDTVTELELAAAGAAP